MIIAVNFQFKQYTSHHFTPHRRHEFNKLTSLPMCGFIAQLVEQRTGNAEVMGSNPVAALIFFFRLLLSNCLNWKFTAMIILYFHLQPQFKYELFHILHIIKNCVVNRTTPHFPARSLKRLPCMQSLLRSS